MPKETPRPDDETESQRRANSLPEGDRAREGEGDEAPEDDGPNLRALGLGLLVILVLLVGTWFLVNAMRCNPMFSDAGLYHSKSCR